MRFFRQKVEPHNDTQKLIDKVDALITSFAVYAEKHENNQQAVKRLGTKYDELANKYLEIALILANHTPVIVGMRAVNAKILAVIVGAVFSLIGTSGVITYILTK